MKTGFTLIELLVVVLIIGILAAIALPQYQKAVDKADYMQLISDVDAISKAEELYFMINGDYSQNLGSLDITLGGLQQKNETDIENSTFWRGDKGYISLRGAIWRNGENTEGGAKSLSNIFAKSVRSKAVYFVYLDHAMNGDGVKVPRTFKRQCLPKGNEQRSVDLCKSLTGGKACPSGDPLANKGQLLVDGDSGEYGAAYCF